jgi:hypothetical protein
LRDRGHAAVELALAVGLLLLPAALVVLGFGPWSERRVAAETIAAEATRAAVLELDVAAGVRELARISEAMGLGDESVRAGWCGAAPSAHVSGGCPMSRGGAVSLTVEVWTPLIVTPWGDIGGLWVSADHSEPIDLYRSLG